MTVTFHCEYCGKKIEAPDSAGGKWGKCPSCHNKLYVPNLSEGEELKLAPIDEEEEARRRRLLDETAKLSEDILQEKEIPDEPTESDADTTVWPAEISDKQLRKNIVGYLRQTAEGQEEAAKRSKGLIVPYGKRTIKILDNIALAEIPEPELAGIPQQVLSGLIRELRSKIG
jgi:hypothetical protein